MQTSGAAIRWPHGRKFAVTIIDDTDGARLDRIRRVYDVIAGAGLRTTKTVWPLEPQGAWAIGGDSLENAAYARWVRELKDSGFEIAMHGASDGASTREHVVKALNRFADELGADPVIHVNHDGQTEALYWGQARLDAPWSWAYSAYRRARPGRVQSLGHVAGSEHFWGDLCHNRIRFVRNFVWPQYNTTRADPFMPYYDPRRPYVRHWFSSSYGAGVDSFCQLLSEENQDRLAEEGGACIVYSHLSAFHGVPARFETLLGRLGRMNGWFPTATELLEYVGHQRGWVDIGQHPWGRRRMQAHWLLSGAIRKFSRGKPGPRGPNRREDYAKIGSHG